VPCQALIQKCIVARSRSRTLRSSRIMLSKKQLVSFSRAFRRFSSKSGNADGSGSTVPYSAVQPLADEVLTMYSHARHEHPFHLLLQDIGLLSLPCSARESSLSESAPQKEREPRCQLDIADPICRTCSRSFFRWRIGLDTNRKFRATPESAERHPDALPNPPSSARRCTAPSAPGSRHCESMRYARRADSSGFSRARSLVAPRRPAHENFLRLACRLILWRYTVRR